MTTDTELTDNQKDIQASKQYKKPEYIHIHIYSVTKKGVFKQVLGGTTREVVATRGVEGSVRKTCLKSELLEWKASMSEAAKNDKKEVDLLQRNVKTVGTKKEWVLNSHNKMKTKHETTLHKTGDNCFKNCSRITT